MTKKIGIFKRLYQKFGVKKIVITFISVIAVLLPTILAMFTLAELNKSKEIMSSDNLTVVMYSPTGEELYRETGKIETDEEASLVGIFNVMRKNLSPINAIPEGTDLSFPISVDMISSEETLKYTYYFSFAEGSSYATVGNNSYKVLTADSERFLASTYAEILYSNAVSPNLITLDGETVTASSVSWNYKNTDGLFVSASKIPVSSDKITYHITGGISLGFEQEPDNCVVSIFDGDEPIYNGSIGGLDTLTIDTDTALTVKIFAEWSSNSSRDFYGTVNYDFCVIIHSRAEFSITANTLRSGEFLVFKATNIIDPAKLKFSSEDINAPKEFVRVNDISYAVIPCPEYSDAQSFSFTVSYGATSKDFTVNIPHTENDPSLTDFSQSAFVMDADLSSVKSNFDSQLFIFGSFISPTEKGFTQKFSFGDNINDGEYYSYSNEYTYSKGYGASVSSVCGGKVAFVSSSESLGNFVSVDIGLGLSLVYSNLSYVDVKAGDYLAVGDVIGKTGELNDKSEGFSLFLLYDGIFLNANALIN